MTIISNTSTTSDIYMCAHCGSVSVELPTFAGGIAKCKGCGWEGSSQELAVQSFQHAHGSDEEVWTKFLREFRLILAREFSRPLTKLLYRWGFVGTAERNGEAVVDPKQVSRYLTAIFLAAARAIVDTREALEKERIEEKSSERTN